MLSTYIYMHICIRKINTYLFNKSYFFDCIGYRVSKGKTILSVKCRPPLWSSGQSSWLQNHRSEFGSRRYQIFWELVGLERGPLSLVSTIVELFGRKSSDSDLESREYGRRGSAELTPRHLSISKKVKVGCLHPVACTRSGSGFPSNATLVWIFFSVTATCFCLMTIFRQKYISAWRWS
jgi:hypothetical protein